MDFEGNESGQDDHQYGDSGMIPIISSTNYADEIEYPTSGNVQTQSNGFKSVSNARLTAEQHATLEDPHEKDILELLLQMDEFEPIVIKRLYLTIILFLCDRFLKL